MSEISIELYADPSNFLRRECPACLRQFKWHVGQTAGHPADYVEPGQYHCPYCGAPADKDQWFTQEQIEYIRQYQMGPASEIIQAELKRSLGRGVKFEPNHHSAPAPLVDLDDMMIVEPPCHDFEPIKVDEQWLDPLKCLVCGSAFQL